MPFSDRGSHITTNIIQHFYTLKCFIDTNSHKHDKDPLSPPFYNEKYRLPRLLNSTKMTED